jgi:hypothetical protein
MAKTLKQLRKDHPNIKARSVSAFLKKLKESEGLGDTIEAITTSTGLKSLFTADGKDCGCDERKKKLNEMFRYKPNCMVRSEYDWFGDFLDRYAKVKESKGSIHKNDIYRLYTMYLRIFRLKLRICVNCASAGKVIDDAVNDLKKVYDTYGS